MSPSKEQCNKFDENEDYIVKGPYSGYVPEPKGMGYAFYQTMSRNRNLTAQIDGITGVKDTYGNLLERCIQTAKEMINRGIQPKDIISICSINHLNSCVPLIAALFIGAIPACLDPMLSQHDIVHLLKQVAPKMIFTSPESVTLIESALEEVLLDSQIIVFGASNTHLEFTRFIAYKDGDFAPIELQNNKETAIIFFSSGTTGMPKGIELSHRGLLGQGNILISQGMCLHTCLLFASFYWISATVLLTCTLLSGGSRLVLPRFEPNRFWNALCQFKVSCTFLAPSQAIAAYKHGRPENLSLTNLTDMMIGGGPLSGHHLQEIRELFPGTNCCIVYGQTECSGIVLNFDRNDRNHMMMMYLKPGSTGFMCTDFACKVSGTKSENKKLGVVWQVVDVESRELLGPNKSGELCFKSDFLMNGYYSVDSVDAWDSDGWLRSGDVGYYDEDHCFFIVDRIKEMLKFQSFHIPPSVIEAVLLTHPKVASAVVVGVPNDEDGDHPVGVILLKTNDGSVNETDFIKYVEERMDDRYRLRGGVKFLDKIPLTATGKVRRNYLRNLVIAGEI
ncbi:hypothetical protein RN001_014826 [Aquatica leii]|uniref:Luciferin 4-monooxygenase n=1 Tax=Aquatica leii TaxID=1421715 RepID=A0AAN7PPV2_9COLE|nr:hypothetical protein RN001_014826 [Aquatica leii]